jgi:hypothetical protein
VFFTIFLVLAAMLLMTGTTYLALQSMAGLPYAPECPTCKCVTAQPLRPRRIDRVLTQMGGAEVRHCPRCGWSGRMRWRLAAERVPRR